MKKEQTGSVKGIFAIIIVFSHFRGYVELSNGFIDTSFEWVIGLFGQLMVTLFFFYSGYGILKSYKLKEDYAKSFFKKRILKTLLHFDLVVMLYVILSFIIKAEYSWVDYVFAWAGWTAVGNSNWFIFVMLSLYVITLIAFFIPKKKDPLLVTCLVFVFSCICDVRFGIRCKCSGD
jgi:peptidoglycan/LPS O-acetylase OafA/YrhL